MPSPASYLFHFRHFKQTLQFLQHMLVKNIDLAYNVGI